MPWKYKKKITGSILTTWTYSHIRIENNFFFSKKKVVCIIIWPVRPLVQFPWKTIREKVPYEGHTRRSDRAGKTRAALLEMRTALLEMAMAKSKRVNDKSNFVAAKVFSLQNESWKWTFLRANFTVQANCPMQNYFISRQLTPKAKKEI